MASSVRSALANFSNTHCVTLSVRACDTNCSRKNVHRKLRECLLRGQQCRSVHSSKQTVQSTSAYCAELVRKYDYENFLATLLYPKTYRSAAFAIRSLNVEIAQVRDVITDKNIGVMRMQFWKEAIDSIYQGTPRQTPVCIEMAKAVEDHKLSKQWITRLIESRTENLSDAPFRNKEHMEAYCENTVSSVLYLLLQAAGVKSIHADHAASHIGKAHGIVTLLRATPFNANRERVYLPTDVLLQHCVSQQSFVRGLKDQPVRDVVFDIASIANRHLETARSFKTDVPREALPVFYNTVMCDRYLKMIQAVDFDVFHPSLQQRNHLLPLHLWMRKLKRTY
ncbi:NADH dehydrogenase (ubiquinone) complex I, assembly factor 6-like [Liolophura sinensis]|uniref:NADH dehydrogenase (ubiquinone) complex I, assembly factor 6-like n=1 Tax=Liolophura sinensis TaxID=3198878 RepID=UPI0031593153